MQDQATQFGIAEEATQLSLELGRLLLINGADTAYVHNAVKRLADALGYQAHLIVSYEAILVTIDVKGIFHTRIGQHVQATRVDMTAVEMLNRIIDESAGESLTETRVRARLDGLESRTQLYPPWLIALTLGLSAAGLARLLGAGLYVCMVVYFAATLGTFVRQCLGQWRFNPLAIPFIAALVSGTMGGVGMRLHPSATQYLSLVAPGMILVPGVPLINGIRDAISNNIGIACAKLAFVSLVILGISLGLFAAAMITGVSIPVAGPTPMLSIHKDAILSGIITIGFAFFFNVRPSIAWACVVCGLCGHTLRTATMSLGLDIVTGTLIGSLVSGSIASVFATSYGLPAATFAFPGVLVMVPGSYAFRAVIGLLEILRVAGKSTAELQGDTLSLVVTTALLTAAIAVGLAIPLGIPTNIRHRRNPLSS